MTVLKQSSVEQGEGKPPIVFDRYHDDESCRDFVRLLEQKIREFSLAIQNKYGYYVVLRKTKADDKHGCIYYVDIREAQQSHVFLTNGYIIEYQFHKEAV